MNAIKKDLGGTLPTRRFPFRAVLLAIFATLLWFVWPMLFQWVVSMQGTLFNVSGDVTRNYQVLGALLTAITLALTILYQSTQFMTLGEASLQASMEGQIEGYLVQLPLLRAPAFAAQHAQLLRLIVSRAARLPRETDRRMFIDYLFEVRLTGYDIKILASLVDSISADPLVLSHLATKGGSYANPQ